MRELETENYFETDCCVELLIFSTLILKFSSQLTEAADTAQQFFRGFAYGLVTCYIDDIYPKMIILYSYCRIFLTFSTGIFLQTQILRLDKVLSTIQSMPLAVFTEDSPAALNLLSENETLREY